MYTTNRNEEGMDKYLIDTTIDPSVPKVSIGNCIIIVLVISEII